MPAAMACRFVLILLSTALTFAQTQSQAPQEPKTPAAPSPTAPVKEPPAPRVRDYVPEPPRLVVVSGTVLMQGGGPAPQGTEVLLSCGGAPATRVAPSRKGEFSFGLGESTAQRTNPPRTVSESLPRPVQLTGCTVHAVAAGYKSTVIELAGSYTNEHYAAGPVILSPVAAAEGTMVSALNLKAPKGAQRSFEKGSRAARKGDWQKARREFARAVEAYPAYVSAWCGLGRAENALKNPDKARLAFEQAIHLDPQFVEPYLPLAAISFEERKWKEVLATTALLFRLDPVNYPTAWLYNAIASLSLGNVSEAETAAARAVKLDTEHRLTRARYVLGVVAANRRDYASAAAHLRAYLAQAPDAPDAAQVRAELAEFDRLAAR